VTIDASALARVDTSVETAVVRLLSALVRVLVSVDTAVTIDVSS